MGSLWYHRHTIYVSQGLTLSTASLVFHFFSPVNYSVAVEEVHPGEYLPHDVLDAIMGQAGRRHPLDVEVQVLVHVLKHQEQVHLSAHLHPLAVANIKQSENIEKIRF